MPEVRVLLYCWPSLSGARTFTAYFWASSNKSERRLLGSSFFLTFRGPCIVIYSYNKSQRDALFLKFIFDKELYMFRTDLLSIIRSLNTVYTAAGIFCFACLALTNLTFRGPCNMIYSYNKSQRDALFLKFIFDKELYMFRTDLLSVIRSLNTVYTAVRI